MYPSSHYLDPSTSKRLLLLFCAWTLLMAGLNPSPAIAQSPIDNPYGSEIQPILVKYCVGCHNENDHESNLKLHSLASIRSGGDAGPALIPSKPEESLILRRLLGIDDPKMPPEDSPQPSPAEIEQIKGWIAQGALGSDPAN
ncbi:MAG: c-type cytochrome domain-containing protein, partial [Planctomycetota bacterium]